MPGVHRVGDLSIDEDIEFQRRTWTVQRVGWVIMALVILAALLGLLGPGIMSEATVGTPSDSLQLVYQRVARVQAPTKLELFLQPSSHRNGLTRIAFDQQYLRAVAIKHVMPQPREVEASAEHVTYAFAIPPSNQRTLVTFVVEPEQFGSLSDRIGMPGQQPLQFRQFIYP